MTSIQHDLLLGEEVMHNHLAGDVSDLTATLDPRYLKIASNLSDLNNVATARTNLGLVAGGTGDIWVEKAGDTMAGNLNMGTYNLIGGTGITDILKLQSTTGNGTLTSPAIQLLTGNNGATTAVTVLNNGNVGIGTTNPGYGLHTYSSTNKSVYNYIQTASTGTSAGARLALKTPETIFEASLYGVNVAGDIITGVPRSKLAFYSAGAGASGLLFHTNDEVPIILATKDIERMRITGTGLVGIGTTAPAGRLHINGTANDQQLIVEAHSTQTSNLVELHNSSSAVLASFDGVGGAVINEQGNATADFRVEGDTDDNLLFVDASADKVGIGKNNPAYKLDVTGEINATTGYRVNGTAGATGTFTTADAKTVTVTNGIITSIV